MNEELLSTVLSFVRCFFTPEKAREVVIRQAHNARIFSEEEMQSTLRKLGLFPRALLVASTQSDEKREATIQQVKVNVKQEVQTSSENAEKLKKAKLAEIEARHQERERTISSFKEDRAEKNERGGASAK